MSKEMLKNLIELVPEEDVEVLYKVSLNFKLGSIGIKYTGKSADSK